MTNKDEKAAAKAAKEQEKAAAKAAKEQEKAAAKAAGPTVIDGIEVGNPQDLRPVELPLVVKPAEGGDWANEAQAEYARTLNAYAYKNPAKWEVKKAVLIKQLAELADQPGKLSVLKGGENPVLSFRNKIIEK